MIGLGILGTFVAICVMGVIIHVLSLENKDD